MKIGVEIVAYREERFIEECIKQFEGLDFRILVMVSDTPWHGEKLPMDKTVEIAEKLGAEVVVGDWEKEHDQRNEGLKILKDCDWVLIVDADKKYSKTSLKNLCKFLERANYPAYGIGNLLTYWKTPNYVIEPPESGGLIVAVRPYVNFWDKRCIESDWDFLPDDVLMHHYSYVRTDEEMKKKISTFEHSDEIVDGWYEKVWKEWDNNKYLENLHPVNPKSFERAIWTDGKII